MHDDPNRIAAVRKVHEDWWRIGWEVRMQETGTCGKNHSRTEPPFTLVATIIAWYTDKATLRRAKMLAEDLADCPDREVLLREPTANFPGKWEVVIYNADAWDVREVTNYLVTQINGTTV